MLSGAQMVEGGAADGLPPGQGDRLHPQEPLREDTLQIRRLQE